MREYVTEAIVLGRRPYRERDWVVELFTESFGPIAARVVGGARTLSKLSPHLDAGTLALVRLARANRFTVADATTLDRFPSLRSNPASFAAALDSIALVRRLAPPHVRDGDLWDHLLASFAGGTPIVSTALALLGHDPRDARCARCGTTPVTTIVFSDQALYCDACSAAFPFSGLVRIPH